MQRDPRQSAALLRANLDRSTSKRERVLAVIDQEGDSAESMSVLAVARRAGVSRSFVYKHPDLLVRIREAASARHRRLPTSGRSSSSTASLETRLVNALSALDAERARSSELELRVERLTAALVERYE